MSIAAIRALILCTLEHDAAAYRTTLKLQAAAITSVAGSTTMIDIVVDGAAPRSEVRDGPIPTKPAVLDADGNEIGELLIWATDGRLSALEFAWWTDTPPTELPGVSQLRF